MENNKHAKNTSVVTRSMLRNPSVHIVTAKSIVKLLTVLFISHLVHNKVTHSLTPWSRVLFEKLIVVQLCKKGTTIPGFYGIRMYITTGTRPYPEPL
jgi:hypothetical protein